MITRKIYLYEHQRTEPISVVYGSAAGIVFQIADYDIPEGATATAYAQISGGSCYQQTCQVVGNDVVFTPVTGFFQPGKNDCQVEIVYNSQSIITFLVEADCERYMAAGDDPTVTPETVLPYVTRAENAAKSVEKQLEELDGHGGIKTIVLDSTSGTAGNGRVSTYKVNLGDGTSTTFQVKDGVKGSTGATGAAASVSSVDVQYASGTSATTAPTSGWSASFPDAEKGKFVWTKTTINFNAGSPAVFYSRAYQGTDGAGAVQSVNGKTGAVTLAASDVSAVAESSVLSTINSYPVSSADLAKVAAMQAVKDYVDRYIAASFSTESWTFELEDGTTVTKKVLLDLR